MGRGRGDEKTAQHGGCTGGFCLPLSSWTYTFRRPPAPCIHETMAVLGLPPSPSHRGPHCLVAS